MWQVGEGSLGPEIKGSSSPLRPRDPAAAGVRCSVAGRVQVGGGEGLGGREQSGAVQSQKETAPLEGAGGGHCSSSEDSCEMPSSSSFSCGAGRDIRSMPGPPPPPLPPPEAKLAPTRPPCTPGLSRRGMSQG